MNAPTPTLPGWYANPETCSTSYWDGYRWTGDTRPPRRPFAAEGKELKKGLWFTIIGLLFVATVFGEGEFQTKIVGLVLGLGLTTVGIYMLRGQGPTTKEIQRRLALEKAQEQDRQQAMHRAVQNSAARVHPQRASQVQPDSGSVNVAQVNAIANQETAKALQNLQQLLFTRTISPEEFQAAKDKLFASNTNDAHTQINKLADLYKAGLIGDYEFIAAKARILGI